MRNSVITLCLLVAGIPLPTLTAAHVTASSQADEEAHQWLDQITWQKRTDGTPSLVIAHIEPEGPARLWGLQPGDRVVSFANLLPQTVEQLREIAATLDPDQWNLTIVRNTRMMTIAVGQVSEVEPLTNQTPNPTSPLLSSDHAIEELPIPGLPAPNHLKIDQPWPQIEVASGHPLTHSQNPLPDDFETWSLGFEVVAFRPEVWTGLDAPVVSGALVQQVLNDSLAEQSGLTAGAIIVAVDGRRIDRPAQLAHHLASRQSHGDLTILAYHGRQLRRHHLSLDPDHQPENSPQLNSPTLDPPDDLSWNLQTEPVPPQERQPAAEADLETLPLPDVRSFRDKDDPQTNADLDGQRNPKDLNQKLAQIQNAINEQVDVIQQAQRRLEALQRELEALLDDQ